jgi:hypothetical protein
MFTADRVEPARAPGHAERRRLAAGGDHLGRARRRCSAQGRGRDALTEGTAGPVVRHHAGGNPLNVVRHLAFLAGNGVSGGGSGAVAARGSGRPGEFGPYLARLVRVTGVCGWSEPSALPGPAAARPTGLGRWSARAFSLSDQALHAPVRDREAGDFVLVRRPVSYCLARRAFDTRFRRPGDRLSTAVTCGLAGRPPVLGRPWWLEQAVVRSHRRSLAQRPGRASSQRRLAWPGLISSARGRPRHRAAAYQLDL